MLPMGASGGRRRATPVKGSPGPLRALAATLGGAALGAAAWFFLVRAAIDFGVSARDGESLAWVFLAAATLGAIACLVLVLVLVTRALTTLGVVGRPKAATAVGRRRASSHK
jgi:hypothetical protein